MIFQIWRTIGQSIERADCHAAGWLQTLSNRRIVLFAKRWCLPLWLQSVTTDKLTIWDSKSKSVDLSLNFYHSFYRPILSFFLSPILSLLTFFLANLICSIVWQLENYGWLPSGWQSFRYLWKCLIGLFGYLSVVNIVWRTHLPDAFCLFWSSSKLERSNWANKK